MCATTQGAIHQLGELVGSQLAVHFVDHHRRPVTHRSRHEFARDAAHPHPVAERAAQIVRGGMRDACIRASSLESAVVAAIESE